VLAFAASLAVFIAVGACVIVIMQARVRPVEQRLARLAQRGSQFDQARVNDTMIGKRSRGVMIRLVPSGFGGGIERMLESAGSSMTTSVFPQSSASRRSR
jgi:hypothetical protein